MSDDVESARLRILDEIESVENDLRSAREWAFTDETAGLVAELAELNAQLQELES